MSVMEALRVENLTKYFGGVKVLEDIAFEVPQGERLGVIGPNGAGKTTLINLINGQLEPTRGRIFFFGEDITASPHPRPRPHRAGPLVSAVQPLSEPHALGEHASHPPRTREVTLRPLPVLSDGTRR